MILNHNNLLANRSYKYDAFGNALGNSVVGSIQRTEAEKQARQLYIKETSARIEGQTQRMLSARDALFNEQVNLTTETSLNDSTSRMLWAINRNNAIDAKEAFATENAANLARRNPVVTSTNAYSDLTQANIQSVSYQHEVNKYNRALNTQAYGEQVRARYERGNQIAADEFAKFQPVQNDLLTGVDVEANIAWGQQRREAFNQSFIGVASNAGKMIKEDGGFVVAYGVTGGASAGASAGAGTDFATGRFYSVDLDNWSLTTGRYRSAEASANFGIPVPEAHVGGELSLYMTPLFEEALSGNYGIAGGAASFGLHSLDLGVIRTQDTNHHGLQFTFTRDFDVTKILPKFSTGNGYVKGGVGGIYDFKKLW